MSKCWAATHVGYKRQSNEDTVEVSSRQSDDTLSRWRGYISNDEGWAIVADGMGGHVAGEIASELAVELLRPVMSRLRDEGDATLAINSANRGLFEAMSRNPALSGMGTTIAAVALRGTEALAFNVGDSRVYLHSGGHLRRLSTDHSVEGHILTQCLGGSQLQALKPHVQRFTLEPYSKLLICSDGLTDMLSEEEIGEQLSRAVGAHPALRLVRAALKAGGHDNVSVIVIEVHLFGDEVASLTSAEA